MTDAAGNVTDSEAPASGVTDGEAAPVAADSVTSPASAPEHSAAGQTSVPAVPPQGSQASEPGNAAPGSAGPGPANHPHLDLLAALLPPAGQEPEHFGELDAAQCTPGC